MLDRLTRGGSLGGVSQLPDPWPGPGDGTWDIETPIAVPDGTAAAPGFCFTSEASGLYLSNPGYLDLTVEGTRRATLSQYSLQLYCSSAVQAGNALGGGSSLNGFMYDRQLSSSGGADNYIAYYGAHKIYAYTGNHTGVITSYKSHLYNASNETSDCADMRGFDSTCETVASSSGAWTNVYHYRANDAVVAGTTITNQYGFYCPALTAGGTINYQLELVDGARVDDTAVAGNTRLMIYDVDNAQLERVTVGATDSGGAGYKVLRIPN